MGFWKDVGGFFKDYVAPIVSPVAGVVSSIIGANSAKQTNEAQIEAAKEAAQFQKEETDTSHQREVEDLRAAGLNPILSAKYGGSASASYAVPQLKNPYEKLAEDVNSAGNLFNTTRMTRIQLRSEKAKADINSAVARQEEAKAEVAEEAMKGQKSRARLENKKSISRERAAPWYTNVLTPLSDFLNSAGSFIHFGASGSQSQVVK